MKIGVIKLCWGQTRMQTAVVVMTHYSHAYEDMKYTK